MPMKTVDYIYRFDPKRPETEVVPRDPISAKAELERGNRMFADWVESCRVGAFSPGEPRFVLNCNHLGEVMGWRPGAAPKHEPFAVVVGCSDARVPVEMVLGQSLNELFVIRVAGNVLDDVGQGSIDYALDLLTHSVKVVVVLGHAYCGAVTGAVDAYLDTNNYWNRTVSHPLRSILRRIMMPVREAVRALRHVYGPEAPSLPGFRQALIDTAVCINAAQTAYDLRHEVETFRRRADVLYGVYDVRSGRVGLPGDAQAQTAQVATGLLTAPARPAEFFELGLRVAEGIRPVILGPTVPPPPRFAPTPRPESEPAEPPTSPPNNGQDG
jgi:carbonic anhydrase